LADSSLGASDLFSESDLALVAQLQSAAKQKKRGLNPDFFSPGVVSIPNPLENVVGWIALDVIRFFCFLIKVDVSPNR
jgi:hypothetical protein